MLSERYPIEKLRDLLVAREDWHPYPTWDEREGWEAIPETVRKAHIAKGEVCLGFRWEPFRATLFLEMAHTGKRAIYDKHRARHRTALCDLVIAECVEGKGRFLDDIVDGMWALCEESFWGKPFTLSGQKAGYDLPDTAEPIVALFVAEAASLVTWTCYLLGPQITSYSSLILPRVDREMQRRMLGPCLDRDDFWWMGFRSREGASSPRVNNWNPWINSNWLTSTLLMEEDPERRVAAVDKSIRSLDRFIDPYPQDGGCDEGPGYWGRAGASLFECLETLHSVTNGAIDVYDDPLIQNIGKFITRVQIHDRYFVNFADAAALVSPSPFLVYRYGKRIGDPDMMGLGAYFAQRLDAATRGVGDSIARQIPALLSISDLLDETPRQPLSREAWLPDVQVMTARDKAGSCDGFYVAAKGGHNAESHNHNDVGHCIIYIDGKPVIIDAGVETYTGKTFSPDRYDIWTMQSAYHGLPTIDGVMQSAGLASAARDVTCVYDDEQAEFSADIAGAYPEDAGIASWQRSIRLIRGESVQIYDRYALTREPDEITMGLLTPCEVEDAGAGLITLRSAALPDGRVSGEGVLVFDSERLAVEVEVLPLEDEKMQHYWGKHLRRIVFTVLDPAMGGTLSFRFSRISNG
jgi:hypothetical protein